MFTKMDIITQQIQAFLRLMFHDLREIREVLTPELRRKMFFLRVLMLVVAILETLYLYVLAFFGTSISDPERVKGSFFVQPILKTFPELAMWCSDNRKYLFLVAVFIVFFIIVKNIITALGYWKTAYFAENVSRDISGEIMRRFLYSPYRWHLSSHSGVTLQAMGWRNNLTLMTTSLLNMQSYVVTTLFLFIALTCVAPLLTLLVYLIMGGAGLLTYKLIRKSTDRAGTASALASGRENIAVTSALRGIREVLIYRQQPVFLKAVSDAARAGTRPRAFLAISSTVPSWVLEMSAFAIIGFSIAMLIKFWHSNMTDIVHFVILLMLVAWRAMPSLNRVVNLMIVIRGVRPFSEPCLALLKSLRASVVELPPPPDPEFAFTRDIRLDNVSFRYPGGTSDCLIDISLAIPKGSVIGFIGPSGAGKSTITTVLSGLLEPTAGVMLVDGKSLSPGQREAYRLRVGYVPQNPYLMAGSLAENVAFSEWGKPYDEARVRLACQRAAIDFVSPERGGIQMVLGENGSGLSGGQAQRVAIARALYANPDVIIFDEATSSLDQANERIIQDTVVSLRKSTTCLIVAHRLTTIEKCDYLYWLDQGKLFAEGPPAKILPRYVGSMEKESSESELFLI
ncbi:MAG: ABC transporter ATP-binding protein [Candidatus Omnitrophota bacterium]|jgi:ABC-type multidrug transport system fused ATPase/permease subunit